MTLLDRILTHKWWLGVSGVVAMVAVAVTIVLDDEPVPPAPAASAHPGTGPGSASRVENGVCVAQGSEISITCVPAPPPPTAEGLGFLRQSAKSTGNGAASFALPADVPLEDFPAGDGTGFCTEEQTAWLRRHGDESTGDGVIRIRNAGTTGAKLNLSDLRIEDLRRTAPEPVIHFACPSAGADDGLIATVNLDRQGDVEVWYPEHEETVPGSAFSFSLDPGEGGWLLTTVLQDSGAGYSGRLVVTARYGDAEQDVTLRLFGEEETFHLPGWGHERTMMVTPADSPDHPFRCRQRGEPDDYTGCTLAQIRERLNA